MNGSKMVLQQCLACNTLVSVIIDNKYVLSCFLAFFVDGLN